MSSSHSPPRVAVIGGGVSGLAAAHRLHRLAPQIELRLFEATDRLGGPLSTLHDDGLVLEQGADSFLTKNPAAVELCRELGLADELIPTNAAHRRAWVVRRGRLEPIPEGFVLMRPTRLGPILRTPVLSPRGKLRLMCEPLVGRHPDADAPQHDETIEAFAVRRLGQEAYERLVEPLMGGIYVGDASRLSLAATMPEFLEAERKHGSLWGGLVAQGAPDGGATGARYSAFLTLRAGVGAFIGALGEALPSGCVRLQTAAASLSRSSDKRWSVTLASGSAESFDAVILAAPAPRAATLVAGFDTTLADLLRTIECASSAVVTLTYNPAQFARPVDAFGFVVPRVEGLPVVAGSFPGVKFPGRGRDDIVPIRVFAGGVLHPELVDRSNDELVTLAEDQLAQLLGVRGAPTRSIVTRWRDAMPQYALGHVQRVAEIERVAACHEGLALAGNAFHGVGIPQCVASGRAAAERIAAALYERPG